jgi:RNA polymerase sigma factor (sigma-70 family)
MLDTVRKDWRDTFHAEHTQLETRLSEEPNPEELVLIDERVVRLKGAIDRLPPRERAVIQAGLMGRGEQLRTAARLKMTKRRASQLNAQGLRKLQTELSA